MAAGVKNRLLLIAAGVVLGLSCIATAALLWTPAQAARVRHRHAKCLTYFLIPWMQICGNNVYLKSHGRRQWIGHTRDLMPMPKPPARRR